MMSLVNSHHQRLMQLIAEARKQAGLERQVDMVRASTLSKSTISRLEKGQELSGETLRTIARTVGWTADSAVDVLAGGEPTMAPRVDAAGADATPLERRYRRGGPVTDSGRLVSVVDDMLYKVFMAGAPDAPFEAFDRARRRVFEVLQEAGVEVAERHKETSSGTDENA